MSDARPEIRESIDQIDAQIVELLDQRARLALDLGQAKTESGEGAFVPARENAVLAKVAQGHRGPFPTGSLRAVFGEIISACRQLQTQDRTIILGERYGWVHDAALAQFGSSTVFTAVEGGDEVIEAVKKDPQALAFLHLGAGNPDINLLLEALLAGKLQIIAETTYLPRFSLVSAQAIELPEVTDLFTTREILTTLRHWVLSLSFPVRINICRSVEEIIENLVENLPNAGLLPQGVAKTLGHHLIQGNLEPHANVPRRCVTVSGKADRETAQGMKTSILCTLRQEPGALHRLLGVAADYQCNLLGIQMFPFTGKAWEDLFLLDFAGPGDAKKRDAMLAELAAACLLFQWVGTYPVMK